MTKQKFYEIAILKTYENYSEADKVIQSEAEKLLTAFGYIPKTFNELQLKRAILGLNKLFPDKHPFGSKKINYFKQVTSFVIHLQDDDFTKDYFELLKSNKKSLVKLDDEHEVGFLYTMFYETLCGEHRYMNFCHKMADFILRNCKKTSWHEKCLSLAYALGTVDDVSLFELTNMRREHEGLEPYKEDPFEALLKGHL